MYIQQIIIKDKTKKTLKVIAVSTLSAVVLVPSAIKAYGEIKYSDYSDSHQMETIAKALDFNTEDTFLIEDQCPRFIHNNGKPIQVVVKEELKDYMPYIKSAMDTMIGTLNSINDSYNYTFVDENEVKSSSSSITFKSNKIDYAYTIAHVNNFTKPYSAIGTSKMVVNNANVEVDIAKFQNESEYLKHYIMLHELAHIFGICGDKYDYGETKCTDKHFGNSFIKVEIGSQINMMTPYDIKSALVLYTPQAENEEDLKSKIKECKKYVKDYEQNYYDYYTKRTKELISEKATNNSIISEFKDEDFEFNYSLTENNNDQSYSHNYSITYQANSYEFKIYDTNNNVIDECSGEVVLKNDIMVLKDVTLKNGLTPNTIFKESPNGYVQDLTLFKNDDEIYLFNVFNGALQNGTTYYLENDLTL